VENVEIFIYFPHSGNFLLHILNSCRGNYSREETIRGNTVCTIERKFSGLTLGTGCPGTEYALGQDMPWSILTIKFTHQIYQSFLWLKFRYSGKATQIFENLPLCFDVTK
jgi:hypothetical protein